VVAHRGFRGEKDTNGESIARRTRREIGGWVVDASRVNDANLESIARRTERGIWGWGPAPDLCISLPLLDCGDQ
jgi:hypothetical protein